MGVRRIAPIWIAGHDIEDECAHRICSAMYGLFPGRTGNCSADHDSQVTLQVRKDGRNRVSALHPQSLVVQEFEFQPHLDLHTLEVLGCKA